MHRILWPILTEHLLCTAEVNKPQPVLMAFTAPAADSSTAGFGSFPEGQQGILQRWTCCEMTKPFTLVLWHGQGSNADAWQHLQMFLVITSDGATGIWQMEAGGATSNPTVSDPTLNVNSLNLD